MRSSRLAVAGRMRMKLMRRQTPGSNSAIGAALGLVGEGSQHSGIQEPLVARLG